MGTSPRNPRLMAWLVPLAVAAGCSFTPGGSGGDGDGGADAVSEDGTTTDTPTTDTPTVDTPTTDTPIIDTPGIDACVPGCTGSTLTECPGGMPMDTQCPLGCSVVGQPHCMVLVPSNLPGTSDLSSATGGLTLLDDYTYSIFTDTGQILARDPGMNLTELRAAGPLVDGTVFRTIDAGRAVLAVADLTIPETATVYVFGSRALILLSSGAVVMHGAIDVGPGCTLTGEGFTSRCAGPGGGNGAHATGPVPAEGCAPGESGVNGGNEAGGAGGGYATTGGNGGAGATTPMATSTGTCTGATLEPLSGGSGGGAGAPSGASWGGGGGGALQITSMTSLTMGTMGATYPPQIYAGGAGGKGVFSANKGGGGGGSGGAILIEAPIVTIVGGELIAAGGGGAGGRTVTSTSATTRDGQWGRLDGMPALGGIGDGTGNDNGRGGSGATDQAAATNGNGGVDGTGGGGGGLGRIRINNLDGDFVIGGTTLAIGSNSIGAMKRE